MKIDGTSVTLSRQKNELYQFCIANSYAILYKSLFEKCYYQFARKITINLCAKISHFMRKATPDIVFTKKKIAIFVHGCYWHGHGCGSRYAHTSQSNKEYWAPKIERTRKRDQEHIQELETDGWKVIVLWECQIRENFDELSQTLNYELLRQ